MINKRQLFKNSFSNYSAFLVSIIITLLITPFVLSRLGDEYYGYWSLIVAFTGYFGFLDFGVRAGVGQYITRYLSTKDFTRYNDVVSTSLYSLLCISFVGILVSFIVSFFFVDLFFNASMINQSFRMSFFIVGVSISLKFPFVVFQSILNGIHRFDVTSFIAIICKLLNSFFVFLVLLNGFGILGLACVVLGTQLVEGFIMLLAARKYVPETIIYPKFIKTVFKDITGYGFFSFWGNIADQVSFYVGPLLIGKMLGAVAVTYYSVAANLVPYLASIAMAISGPLRQLATGFDGRSEGEGNKVLFLQGTRYVFLLMCFICSNVFSAGEIFLGYWLSEKYISGLDFPSSGLVLKILIIGYLSYLSHTVGRQILFGTRKNKCVAVSNTFVAISTVLLSLYLMDSNGILGCAIALSISLFINNVFILPYFSAKQTGVKIFNYYMYSISPGIICFLFSVLSVEYMFSNVDIDVGLFNLTKICVYNSLFFILPFIALFYKDIMVVYSNYISSEK